MNLPAKRKQQSVRVTVNLWQPQPTAIVRQLPIAPLLDYSNQAKEGSAEHTRTLSLEDIVALSSLPP